MLLHAARVYTRKVFKVIQKAFMEAANFHIVEHPADYNANYLVFVLRSSYGRPLIDRRVTVQRSSDQLECSCCKFMTDGIFCNHIINIMLLLNIRQLPKQYILKRWTKCAKVKVDDPPFAVNGNVDPSGVLGDVVFVNHVIRIAYELAVACKDEPNRKKVHYGLKAMKSEICLEEVETPSPKPRPVPVRVTVNGHVVKNPIPKLRTKENEELEKQKVV